jgi:hypothetical protein
MDRDMRAALLLSLSVMVACLFFQMNSTSEAQSSTAKAPDRVFILNPAHLMANRPTAATTGSPARRED